MFLISHRGNTDGRILSMENNPAYIEDALKKGYGVEIDVRVKGEQIMLGHDKADHVVSKKFLQQAGIWCHAKNIEALQYMIDNNITCFWHERDMYSLTSNGYIWTFPGEVAQKKSIVVHNTDTPFNADAFGITISGICSDYIERF